MTIKRRFLSAYISAILITLGAIIGILALSSYTTLGEVPTLTQAYKMLTQQRQLTKNETTSYARLDYFLKKSPALLETPFDPQVKATIKQIQNKGLLVVIRKNQNFTYYSPELVKKSLRVHAPKYEMNNLKPTGTIDNAGRLYRYLKADFYYSDGSKGSFWILKRESNLFEFFTRWGIWVILAIVALGILAAWLINRQLQKTIIRPLEQLQQATKEFQPLAPLNLRQKAAMASEVACLQQSFNTMWQDLQQAAKKQQQLEKQRKELIANISHDLKTPMTSIIGYVEGLLDGVANTPAKQKHYLQVIHEKSLSLNDLIEELFLYAKLDSDEFSLNFEQVDLGKFLNEFYRQYQAQCDLTITLLTQPMPVKLDSFQMKRVLTNVTQNSLKFADPQKKALQLKVSLISQDKWWVIKLSDNGIGIADCEITHVFERFYRVDKSRTPAVKGSGLGLSIVQQIMQAHHGKVELTSQLGRGTTVWLYLPKN